VDCKFTERVTSTTVVSLNPSHAVHNFTINAAAMNTSIPARVDLAWQEHEWLAVRIHEFQNIENGAIAIPSAAFQVRHVENIIGGAFPDLLKPFGELNVDGPRNTCFGSRCACHTA